MVLGLLTTSLLSIICFVITVAMGFLIPGKVPVSQHILWGFFSTFLVTLSQSMTMFYFIGTGKYVKDLVANEPTGNEFIRRTKVFKAKVFPPALWAMLFTMAAMILGGGVHTRIIPSWVHLGLSAIALYYNVVALARDARYMMEHNMLMQEVERMLQAKETRA